MFEHKEADRVPIVDSPWGTTIERWKREGMPDGTDFRDYFDIDKQQGITIDNSPRYEEKIIEETDGYLIEKSKWGATIKYLKYETSTPEFLDFTIKTPDDWYRDAKPRMTPTRDRIPWDHLAKNYKRWRDGGAWLELRLPFGFDYTHSWVIGTENLLIAMMDEPEWCADMFGHFLDVGIELMDMIIDEGYEFDSLFWWDDMGFKNNQFFSLNTYRELVKPVHKRAIEWAHSRKMVTHLHSCGDIRPLIPELVEIGLDGLNPLEVKAGMDPFELKKRYGNGLTLHGGVNAVLWDDAEAIEKEMRALIPVLKEGGGYIFSSDHSVPSSVSLANFKKITDLAKELGSY